ncbi:hypothetical protein D3C73_1475300 [compost metagenome]
MALTTTGLVTPRMVRSPVTSAVFSPVDLTLVETKVALANLLAFRKSALAMCLSRSAWLVNTLAVLTLNSILLASGLAASKLNLPSMSLKVPVM